MGHVQRAELSVRDVNYGPGNVVAKAKAGE